ncbi:MAG: hypothetical protein ACYTGH_13655 [Planctomycetota bacterium]|jgi:hypothetical protein
MTAEETTPTAASPAIVWTERLTSLLFLAVACWIGNDCYQYHQRTAGQLLEASDSIKRAGKGIAAKERNALLELRQSMSQERISSAAIAMGWLHSYGDTGLNGQLATLYRNLGNHHSSAQNARLAARAWALSLVYKPGQRDLALSLAQECFTPAEWDMGLIALEECSEEDATQASRLKRLFTKRKTAAKK